MSQNPHLNRRPRSFQVRKVKESLPEYFAADFPKLVSFLENYYEFMDSDGPHGFGEDNRRLFDTRDIHATQSQFLNNLVSEIAGGLKTGENFSDVRFALTRLAQFAQHKGSRFSIEEFFRLFFQQAAEVEYPKRQIFTVGESEIGAESLKFIQNAELFQIFSLLIKVGIDTSQWSELYKKFVHPAGFFFAGEVILEREANLSLFAPLVVSDSAVGPILTSEALLSPVSPFTQMTGLIDSDATTFRVGLDQIVSVYQNLSAQQIDKFYSNTAQLIGVNSFKFDDSDIGDSAGAARPDFSLTTETMDNEMFTRYTSDSSF